jgi:hypothetical protein
MPDSRLARTLPHLASRADLNEGGGSAKRIPEDLADRPRVARPHHWRVVADRGAVPSLMTGFTPFFEFALLLAIQAL